jgi:hypothetical protein
VVEAEDKEAPVGAGGKTTPVGGEAWAVDGPSDQAVSVSARIAVTRRPMSAGYPASKKSAPSVEPT